MDHVQPYNAGARGQVCQLDHESDALYLVLVSICGQTESYTIIVLARSVASISQHSVEHQPGIM